MPRARPELIGAWARALHCQPEKVTPAAARVTGAEYIIPVVVHIIHQDGA
ncbi:MAG: hypothetical protein N2110_06660 [Flavobacteriales bacterium]|nr:hypothetical protein [Flavobacteriales bacterium]MCX7768684.1 hypothetical protein [Flavobacteriales bacterium]MDW8410117.1 hypothetical protein [Flavobacteriales bacterium]